MATTTRRVPGRRRTPCGTLLREWRAFRRVSQLALALQAEISQRHLSFVESGRARPSREMVLRIAEALDLPLRARNELLAAAGFAPFYRESGLEAPELKAVTEALARILSHHEPYPALILDSSWDIRMGNEAARRLMARCTDRLGPGGGLSSGRRVNFIREMFHPAGIRRRVLNWERTAAILVARLRREAVVAPGSPSEALLREVLPEATASSPLTPQDAALSPTIPLELSVDGETLRLFNTLTTFGTPQDVTVQELRIEMSFPADDDSDALLRRWAVQEPR